MDPDPATACPTGSTTTAGASPPPSSSSLIFLGTGCSGALPDARCLIQPSAPPCAVCSTALSLRPDRNPNYGCALCFYGFQESGHLYSVILAANFYSVAARFPNLVKQSLQEYDDFAKPSQLDWTIIEDDVDKPFIASELEFSPLPVGISLCEMLHFYSHACFSEMSNSVLYAQVMHGEDYVCLGFLFGRKARVAYLSDVSRILPRTEHGTPFQSSTIIYSNSHPRIMLTYGQEDARSCHLTLSQSLDAIKKICPKKALLIGMNHEFEHHRENQMLAGWSHRCA
nr:unnamed protein product [Digitaria exilis]